jgi:hypothetical protein
LIAGRSRGFITGINRRFDEALFPARAFALVACSHLPSDPL